MRGKSVVIVFCSVLLIIGIGIIGVFLHNNKSKAKDNNLGADITKTIGDDVNATIGVNQGETVDNTGDVKEKSIYDPSNITYNEATGDVVFADVLLAACESMEGLGRLDREAIPLICGMYNNFFKGMNAEEIEKAIKELDQNYIKTAEDSLASKEEDSKDTEKEEVTTTPTPTKKPNTSTDKDKDKTEATKKPTTTKKPSSTKKPTSTKKPSSDTGSKEESNKSDDDILADNIKDYYVPTDEEIEAEYGEQEWGTVTP